ncbi:HAMP domain-containing sensor histidine kinase [Corynebacterium lizhenjunii]|uniref:sensor histidine kinase n=1 Tax=Corynebacterium lizhenjunii TaxID=2709394 RepID=UPI00314526F1
MTSGLATSVPLRVSLMVMVVVVSALGLGISSLAVNTIMRETVYGQVDKDLRAAVNGWARNEELLGDDNARHPPSEYSLISFQPNGREQYFNLEPSAVPKVEDLVIDGPPQTVDATPVDGTRATSPKNSPQWRAIATEYGGTVIVVAKRVERENNQLRGLAAIQMLISFAVLVIISLVSYWGIQRALRPLQVVEKTASEIAAGNLDKRVPKWDARTEVGELSQALNGMLAQIQRSVETAQNKEEQMRRFVGDASHELRTPLTSLRGYTELYRSGATDDVDRVLEKVNEESTRMSLLVEDLLALTRAEGNRLELRTVDLLELALSAGSSARAAFPGRKVEVHNQSKGIPLVNGDPDRLHQVLLNLVSNGLRHGGEDAEVSIDLREVGTHVCIDVTDNGRGMSPDVASHIFERFYRADTSRTRDTGGSGLGLAITKSIVEQHGGEITLVSEEGVGSTFTVALPKLEQPQLADAPSGP